jgi:hypothetical protein
MARFTDKQGYHYAFDATRNSDGNTRGFVRSNRFGYECRPLEISNDMPDCGGGERSAQAVANDDGDDDGGDSDGEPARRKQRSSTNANVIGVTEFDIAKSIGMSVEFLRKDRSGKRLIPFYRIGKSIRYSPHRVIQALATLEEGGHTPRPKAKKSVNSLSAG